MKNVTRNGLGFNATIGLIILALALIVGVAECSNSFHRAAVKGAVVERLQQQQLVGKSGTNFKYLIITPEDTFICESSMINGKFDNSNIFYHLKEGHVYDFEVCGYGKNFLFNYRNILEAKEVKPTGKDTGYRYPPTVIIDSSDRGPSSMEQFSMESSR